MFLGDVIFDLFWGLFVLGLLLGLYFLPTIVGFSRNVPSPWSIAVINLFFGWTFVGWVIALAMSARSALPSSASQFPAAASSEAERLRRPCPSCQAAMPPDEGICPQCGTGSTPWVHHAGVWWTIRKSDEWQWLDEERLIWRWYKDGTPSDPATTDRTPNLRINPALVRPPDAPRAEPVAAGEQRSESFAEELERLADLHAREALSDNQFEAAKQRLLGVW
jgi:hypothetical protein